MRSLERDVATGVWRGETVQEVWWLLLVWDGKWAVTLLKRNVATGIWTGERVEVVGYLLLVWNGK